MSETNEERLGRIKEEWKLKDDDEIWLIEQAEHAEKLVKLYQEQGTSLSNRSHDSHALKAENKRLRKALEFYAEGKTYQLGINISMGSAFPQHEPIKSDKGDIARQALEIEGLSTN